MGSLQSVQLAAPSPGTTTHRLSPRQVIAGVSVLHHRSTTTSTMALSWSKRPVFLFFLFNFVCLVSAFSVGQRQILQSDTQDLEDDVNDVIDSIWGGKCIKGLNQCSAISYCKIGDDLIGIAGVGECQL